MILSGLLLICFGILGIHLVVKWILSIRELTPLMYIESTMIGFGSLSTLAIGILAIAYALTSHL